MLKGWLSRLMALTRRADAGHDAGTAGQSRPFVRRGWRYTSLQFNRADAQSRMLTFQPDRLLVDYTRTMMGALLFHPSPATIGVIGLGGGSQVKFCHRHLQRTRIEVAEINPHVIALRRRFRVPDDDARLWVARADGAEFVRERPGRYDVLLVDGYDEGGIPEALSTRRFYEDCRNALTPHGVMASNLYTADVDRHINRLRRCFGERLVVLEEEAQRNRVAFAWVGEPLPPGPIDVDAVLAGIAPQAREQLAPVFGRLARALMRSGAYRRA